MKRKKASLKDLRNDWWTEAKSAIALSNHFQHHIVALFMAFVHDGKEEHRLFSGFLYSHFNVPMWITAGHVFENIRQIEKSPTVKITKVEWLDNTLQPPHGIPLDLSRIHEIRIDERGVDIAIVILPPYYARLISANDNNSFLTERMWHKLSHAKPEGYYIVGYPAEKHRLTKRGDSRNLFAPLYCVPMNKIEDRPDEYPDTFWGRPGAFYGKIVPTLSISDIKFMSGGPIFSIQRGRSNHVRYYLFGVQSVWLKSKGIVRATGMETVGAIIDEILKHFHERQKQSN